MIKSKSLEELIVNYEQALASQEWEQVAPLIHPDCTVTFSEGTHIGKNAVEIAFRKTFNLIEDEKYKISDIHWVLRNTTVAVMVFNFAWSGIIDGKNASGGGRGTSVLVKENDSWQIISEHLGPPAS